MEYPAHTGKVQAALACIKGERDSLLKLGMEVIQAGNGNLYPLDFLAIGTVKRYLSTAAAFSLMIETWNILCARLLLRTHIDTALRFSAAWLVNDPHEFASAVMGGTQIDHLKDRDGKKLSDAHLVKTRSSDYPWLPEVYKNLSGYVHFSDSHIWASIVDTNKEDSTVLFAVNELDTKFPESSWLELTDCFTDATSILCDYLGGYAETKRRAGEHAGAGNDAHVG